LQILGSTPELPALAIGKVEKVGETTTTKTAAAAAATAAAAAAIVKRFVPHRPIVVVSIVVVSTVVLRIVESARVVLSFAMGATVELATLAEGAFRSCRRWGLCSADLALAGKSIGSPAIAGQILFVKSLQPFRQLVERGGNRPRRKADTANRGQNGKITHDGILLLWNVASEQN
jgi:hypothetical protein